MKLSIQNLPRDALPEGMGEKLSTLKRPKKYKTSENDFSHGSFFLRIGGIGETENTEHYMDRVVQLNFTQDTGQVGYPKDYPITDGNRVFYSKYACIILENSFKIQATAKGFISWLCQMKSEGDVEVTFPCQLL